MNLVKIRSPKSPRSGFTIVELIIVIVVIAILAAIIIVAFNGVKRNAIDSRIKGDLSAAASKLGALQATDDSSLYASSFSATGINSSTEEGKTQFLYNTNAGRTEYCLQAINTGRTWFITEDNTAPQAGTCNGILGVQGDGNYTAPTSANTSFNGLSSTNGASQMFSVEVPAGSDYVTFRTSGGTESGNGANIRVRQGAQPTSSTNACTSANSDNNENCYMYTPTAGTWWVEVYISPGTDTYSGVDLYIEWGTWQGTYSSPIAISGDLYNRKIYKVNVPAGQDYVNFKLNGGTSVDYGANMSVRYNALPGNPTYAPQDNACSSGNSGNYENCYIYTPQAGTWYVEIHSGWGSGFSIGKTSTYANATLTVDYGMWQGNYSTPVTLSGGYFDRKIYSVNVPAGQDYANFRLGGGTYTSYGAELAVKYNAIPGSPTLAYNNADCYSVASDNSSNCFIYAPTAGTYYVEVYSSSGSGYSIGLDSTYSNAVLDVTWGNWPSAYSGPTSVSAGLFERKIYAVTVPAGKTSITFSTSGGTMSDMGANLAARYNALPGSPTVAYDNAACQSIGFTNTESCTVNNPTAGTWYVSVFSSPGSGYSLGRSSVFSGTTLTVTMAP